MARGSGESSWVYEANIVAKADVGTVVAWFTDTARSEEWRRLMEQSASEPINWRRREENGERIDEADYLCRNGRQKSYRSVTTPVVESCDSDGSERKVLVRTLSVVQTRRGGEKGSTTVNSRIELVGRGHGTEISVCQTTVCAGSPWSWRLAASVIGPLAQRLSGKRSLRQCKASVETSSRT